jgi:hypothetical protein
MTALARRIVLPLALIVAMAGSALAARSAPGLSAKAIKSSVMKNRAARGKSTRVKTQRIRSSRSGKSEQVLSWVPGEKGAEAYNVNKSTETARRTPTGLETVGSAEKTASGQLHRERSPGRGEFAGVNFEGVTRGGNYRFASATDHTEKVYVSPTSGKVVRHAK